MATLANSEDPDEMQCNDTYLLYQYVWKNPSEYIGLIWAFVLCYPASHQCYKLIAFFSQFLSHHSLGTIHVNYRNSLWEKGDETISENIEVKKE